MFLTDDDADRFARDPRLASLTVLYTHGVAPYRVMRRDSVHDRCAALRGPLHDCRCTIYADRPEACRRFEAGSAACLAARRRAGIADSPAH